MIRLDTKLPSVGTTIFTVMSRLAADLGAINLSQGFPDFDCDPALVDAVAAHMRSGQNQYAPMQGVLRLREAIAANVRVVLRPALRSGDRDHGDLGRHRGHLRRGRRARSAPATRSWCSNRATTRTCPAIELSGGTPVFVPLQFPDYSIDWDEVRRAVTPRRG